MNETSAVIGSRERRIGLLADELRAEAANGLYYGPDAGDAERFTELRSLAARLLAQVDLREAEEIEAAFRAVNGPATPRLGVVLILSHQRDGVMLVGDPETGVPGAPHGFVPYEQDPETALRELARRVIPDEEIVPVPHGVCDSVAAGLPMCHTYYLTYVVDVTFVPADAFATTPVAADHLTAPPDALTRYIIDGSDRDVLDAPLYLPAPVSNILERMRSIASEGVEKTTDPYNTQRWGRVLETAEAVLATENDDRPLVPADFGPLDVVTPNAAGEMLIIGDDGRILLMRRSDTGEWAMPGGGSEVGESSAATAVRECQEELGVDVVVDGLAGAYDGRTLGVDSDFVCFVYVGRIDGASPKPRTTVEAVDFGWFDPAELDGLDMFMAHDVKIARALKVISP